MIPLREIKSTRKNSQVLFDPFSEPSFGAISRRIVGFQTRTRQESAACFAELESLGPSLNSGHFGIRRTTLILRTKSSFGCPAR
jgi:hypothetical protein